MPLAGGGQKIIIKFLYIQDEFFCLSSGKAKKIIFIPGPDLALKIKRFNIKPSERISILDNLIDRARAGL